MTYEDSGRLSPELSCHEEAEQSKARSLLELTRSRARGLGRGRTPPGAADGRLPAPAQRCVRYDRGGNADTGGLDRAAMACLGGDGRRLGHVAAETRPRP